MTERTTFPTSKDYPELAAAFDGDIAAFRASGELEQIVVAGRPGRAQQAVVPGWLVQ
ncbi:MAG: hypothetical protein O3B90_04840 [Actinomycetota bacterium]|uniref:hypothetical protein n=1 Tax=uncultured Ilumatobacter sp. TaxID=879968 RepID=UPI00374F95B2|nr:hypothetical protein [Actinomycetota bacterium]